jgi:hypothetical protein
MNELTKFVDLPIDLINHILFICDYKSILYLHCTCKLINNIDLEIVLIDKSKIIKNIIGNTNHLVPLSTIFDSPRTYDDTIISCLKYLLNNNIDFAYGDKILPDNRNGGCIGAIGFTGCKGIITLRGIVITPTYKIFQKFLKFQFY